VRTYEVFLKPDGKDPFEHAGSLDAPDDELAVLLARESYVRRHEGYEMWVVAREHILHGDPEFLAVNAGREHRHNDGSVVAGRRRARRVQ
jgi:ring-1,2-phenylacetyl-CoA epoxidase subunit PaaB